MSTVHKVMQLWRPSQYIKAYDAGPRLQHLFGAGQQGAAYLFDKAHQGGLFQDAAFTTPVTAVEQYVGSFLDWSGNGNHCAQTTSTARSKWSARVNLLTQSDSMGTFAGANATFTAAPLVPSPKNTADVKLLEADASANPHTAQSAYTVKSGVKYRYYQYFKKRDDGCGLILRLNGSFPAPTLITFDFTSESIILQANAVGGSINLQDGWYLAWIEATASADGTTYLQPTVVKPGITVAYDGLGGKGVYLWGADFRLATNAHLPYQWVNTATDYDTAGFPHYLSFDGDDDFYATSSNINFANTEVFLCQALTALDMGDVTNINVSAGSNFSGYNSFGFGVPKAASGSIGWYSAGSTALASPFEAGLGVDARSMVLTGIADQLLPLQILRRDGVQKASAVTPTGVGGYGNRQLHIGGTTPSRFFKGYIHGLVVCGTIPLDADITFVENTLKRFQEWSLEQPKNYAPIPRVSDLFRNGVSGVWLDPSDMSTMWQDSAGTVPAAMEQPVGLILDKSQSLTPGLELISTQNVSAWTSGGLFGNYFGSTSPDQRTIVAAYGTHGARSLRFACTPDMAIRISALINLVAGTGGTTASVYVGFGNSSSAYISASVQAVETTLTTPTPVTVFAMAPAGAAYCEIILRVNGSGASAHFAFISAKSIPGNHFLQTMPTKRPYVSARVNLLVQTEQFELWPGTTTTAQVTPNSGVAPDGTTTAATITNVTGAQLGQAIGGIAIGTSCTFSIWVKRKTGSGQVVLVDANGDIAPINVTSEWQKFSVTITTTSATVRAYLRANVVGDAVYVWHPQLCVTSDSYLPYQKVTSATDYDWTLGKFPYYLRFDGADDCLVTSRNVNFTGSDKLTFVAGYATENASLSFGMLCELSSNAGSTPKTFMSLVQDIGTTDSFNIRGASGAASAFIRMPSVARQPVVLTGLGDMSQTTLSGAINGRYNTNTAGTKGGGYTSPGGNFTGSAPMFIGARDQSSLFFKGRLHSLIVRGAKSSDAEVSFIEKTVANLQCRELP